MQERSEPKFVKFGVGEVVEGVLIKIEQVEIGELKKKATRYTVEDLESKELSSFLGAYQIDTKLRQSDRGHFISVRYEGEEKNVVRNGHALRRYTVRVSNQPVRPASAPGKQLEDGTFITDDDVAF